MSPLIYQLRVIRACLNKELQLALSSPRALLLEAFRPLLVLILMSLMAVSGSVAPTAVVMQDTGPSAQAFYTALANAHSFRLQTATEEEAQSLIQTGRIVAVVTIPADFDVRVQQNQSVQIPVQINNLNTDFTDDIRRAVPLAITLFYGKAFPQVVSVTPEEHDLLPNDTDFLPYLGVAILVLALMTAGLLQGGDTAAREWENATIKELQLSPANRFAIVVGKMLGALVIGGVSVVVTLACLILLIGIWPLYWGEMIGFTLLTMLIFVAYGTLLGMLLKDRRVFQLVALTSTLPLFVLSGALGPISFQPPVAQAIAQLFPVYYAVVLEQHAFHGFELNTYGLGLNAAILFGYTVLVLVVAALILRRSTATR